MADITGTTGVDTLIGTSGDDYITPLGTGSTAYDYVSGGNGADTYDLHGSSGLNTVIDDKGTDGATDQIVNAGGLYHSASLGYVGWAEAERVGDDLVIFLPSDPDRFHDPGSPAYNITIVDHYNGGAVESIECAGVVYQLPTSGQGTLTSDIIAGSAGNDRQSGLGGDDWMFGNDGHDRILLGEGNNYGFGGTGNDAILGGAGDDYITGEDGNDRINAGDGQNHVLGGAGMDRIIAGDGFDWIEGGADSDLIIAGAGSDMVDGGDGNDRMSGGTGGDEYIFTADAGVATWGHDIIYDGGNAPSYLNEDVIDLRGFYGASSGTSAEAYAAVHFERHGDDMLISFEGDQASITVVDMFASQAGAIEQLTFNGAYWSPLTFEFVNGSTTDLGNDRDHGSWGSELNEIMFGTDQGEEIFGGTGTNFIWTGDGEDVLVYKLNDGESLGSLGGAVSHDIVEDFDVTQDKMDFSETGLSYGDLIISEDADGDALISWTTPDWEIANIEIELRGVGADEVTEDLFLF